MTARVLVPLLLLSAVAAGPARAQSDSVAAHAWVDSTNYQVGDPIGLHITVHHPAGAAIQPPVGDSLGPFTVLQRLPVTAKSETEATTGLLVAYYDSGTVTIPPAVIPYAFPGDRTGRMAQTNPVTVTVHTVAVDTSKSYRDLKPPLSIPISLAELAFYAAAILALAALAWFGWRWWQKRKKKPSGEIYVPPPAPAHILALEELGAIKERKLWQRGLVKQYYSEVTEVIRRYFERRFEIRALEETTDEILEALRAVRLPPEPLGHADRMLRLADLVKFAKFEPGITDHEELLAQAYAIVDKTRDIPVPAAPGPAVENHVGS